jgi:hypothetical protein
MAGEMEAYSDALVQFKNVKSEIATIASRVTREAALPPHKSDHRYSRPSHGGLLKTCHVVEDQTADLGQTRPNCKQTDCCVHASLLSPTLLP